MIYKIRCAICHEEAEADSGVRWDTGSVKCDHGYFFIDAGSPPCVRYMGDFKNMEVLDKEGEWKPFVTSEVGEIVEENFVSKQLKWDLSKLSGTWEALEYVERLEAQVKDYEQVLEHYADLRNWKPYTKMEMHCRVYDTPNNGFAKAGEILEKYRKK